MNANTLLVNVRRSMPFGERRGAQPTGWPGEKGFVGGTTDPTGLTHLGAREYDPSLGRFLSVDPVIDPSDPQQISPYTYANSSPVTSSDPSGLYVVGGVDDLGRPWGVSYPATKGHDANLVGIWPEHNSGSELINRKQAAQQRQYWNRQRAHAQHLKDRGIDEAEVQRARDLANKKLIDVVIEAGGEILKDFLGITDIEECFGDGNVGSCISMVINAIPVGKILRVGEYIGAVKRAFRGVMDFLEKLPGARSLISKADDAEAEFNAVSSEAKAVEEVGESCAINSFTPDTPVLLADGTRRPIEDVKVGDRVLTTDPETGRTEPHAVARTIVGTGQKDLVQLTIDSGDERAPQVTTVTATANHPFWVPSHQQWMDAADLLPGDVLLTSTGTWVHVTAIKHWTALQRVHNLTVEDVHTYFAGTSLASILVHNCDRAGKDFTDQGREKVYQGNRDKNAGELKCAYCGQLVTRRPSRRGVPGRPDDAQVDHVVPRARGGHGGPHNGDVACRRCNRDKSTKTMDEWDNELRDYLDK